MSYRVFIPVAGTGSRLGNLTRFLNKSLVSVAHRPVLSHLVEQFPADVEFVLALGHKGELVREFLELAYPNRTFLYSNVHPFEGPGSGLGLSTLFCRNYLQEPFVFCSCDTLVDNPIRPPDSNWMGYAEVPDPSPYRTILLHENCVQEICEKGLTGPENKAYIGLAGIVDYAAFWEAMESGGEQAVTMGEVFGMRALLGSGVKGLLFNWCDTGNPDSLSRTRTQRQCAGAPNILDKPNEAIWFVNNTVIKFSTDEEFIRNRVKRATHLKGYCPPVIMSTRHMYQYQMVEGSVLSEVITLPLFRQFLDHAASFWLPQDLNPTERTVFRRTCLIFYREKTELRVRQFFQTLHLEDGTELINGVSMPTLAQLFSLVNWDWLAEGMPGRFHGDFHFENVIWSPSDGRFHFLDWRQDFGGSLTTGDIYYDLAKLLHGLIVSHDLIARDLFNVEWREDNIRFDLLRRQVLVECEDVFQVWLQDQGYDVRKVRILTAMVFLNIAALHHHPYCLMLFVLGKSMLKVALEGKWT